MTRTTLLLYVVQAVLADRHDADYPIYRGSAHDADITLTSTVFDLPGGKLSVFDTRPLPDAVPALVIDATDPLAPLHHAPLPGAAYRGAQRLAP